MPSKKQRLIIYLSDEEHEYISASAKNTGLSRSTFAKRVCLGHTVSSIVEYKAVLALFKANADQGRLGGLLKMWLSNKDWHQTKVKSLLDDLQAAQTLLLQKARELGQILQASVLIGRYKMYDSDTILTLQQVSEALGLDPRTVKRVAPELGGKRFGNRWRFRWCAVMRYFENADTTQRQRRLLDGAGYCGWQTDSLQNVPTREKTWPGMAGRKRVGGGAEKTGGGVSDPFGLRAAFIVGGTISGPHGADDV